MRVREVVAALPLGRSAVYAAIEAGEIPSVRIRGKIFVPTGELRRQWGVDA